MTDFLTVQSHAPNTLNPNRPPFPFDNPGDGTIINPIIIIIITLPLGYAPLSCVSLVKTDRAYLFLFFFLSSFLHTYWFCVLILVSWSFGLVVRLICFTHPAQPECALVSCFSLARLRLRWSSQLLVSSCFFLSNRFG